MLGSPAMPAVEVPAVPNNFAFLYFERHFLKLVGLNTVASAAAAGCALAASLAS